MTYEIRRLASRKQAATIIAAMLFGGAMVGSALLPDDHLLLPILMFGCVACMFWAFSLGQTIERIKRNKELGID